MTELAVVIPAYKDTYFRLALQSLADQTDKRFKVYIGDDASPFNLKPIADSFANQLDISYTRFNNNIGAEKLVDQWKRCIALTKNEKWLWLFSDDDIADITCVENFLHIVSVNIDQFDVYRYNTSVIDKNGKWVVNTPVGPMIESSEEMAYHLLLGKRGNSMPDHIFSRQVYDKNAGFVNTDFAQAADWATSILFSREKGICIIPDARLFWRNSGENITSVAYHKKSVMMRGHLQFIKWLLVHFDYLKEGKHRISYPILKNAARINLRTVIINHYKGVTLKQATGLVKFLKIEFGLAPDEILSDLYLIKKHTLPPYFRTLFAIRRFLLKIIKGVFQHNHTNI